VSAMPTFTPSPRRREGRGEGRVLATPSISPLPLAREGLAFALASSQVTKRFRAPAGARATSLLLVQKRSSQEKTTPRWRALRPSMGCGCAGGLRGFSTARPCTGEKLARIPASHPADFPPPTRRALGAPGKAARSCAQKQQQQQRPEHPTPALLCAQGRETARARSLAVASASGAHDARLLLWGPWAAVRWGRQGRAAGIAMEGDAFSRGQEPARKARPRLTDLPGRMPGKRQPGWPSLLVTFLLATQEKSNSGAVGARKPFALNAARASRTGCAPTGAREPQLFAISSAKHSAGAAP